MTKLSHWLEKRKLSKADFASMVKRSRQTVHRWCTGEVVPDLKTISVIETQTNGEVTANDFMDDDPELTPVQQNVSKAADPSEGSENSARGVSRTAPKERAA
jgi:transcriptional regulator with XRE-family HTH domain